MLNNSQSTTLMRSLMFVPAHNDKLMQSALRSDADVLLFDIEDSVQPKENKKLARTNVRRCIESGGLGGKSVFPRINDRESGFLLDDLIELTIPGVDGFMCPKSKCADDIYFLDKLLETIEYTKGISVGTFKLIPLIETASAVLNAEQIARASSRVVALAFGCEDFITDLQGVHDPSGQSIFTPRAIIAMAARANDIVPIDTVHIRVHDLKDLEYNLSIAKNLGFEGMLVLHPKEIDLVHEYFSPSVSEVASANEMLVLAAEAEKDGKGVAVKHGKFIGPPMVAAAKKVLLKNKLINDKM